MLTMLLVDDQTSMYFLFFHYRYLLYTSAGQRLNFNKNQMSSFGSSNSKTTPNNPTLWLKRIVRDLSRKAAANETDRPLVIDTIDGVDASTHKVSTRDVSLNMDLLDIVGVDKGSKSRVRRQSPGRTSLCPTTSQFITPQAALNSKGKCPFGICKRKPLLTCVLSSIAK